MIPYIRSKLSHWRTRWNWTEKYAEKHAAHFVCRADLCGAAAYGSADRAAGNGPASVVSLYSGSCHCLHSECAPLHFLEEKIFGTLKEKENSKFRKLVRPASLILSLILVVGIVMLVILVVVPDLATTAVSLGRNIERSIPKIQAWAIETFHNNTQIVEWVRSIEVNWEQMFQSVMDMLRNSLSNVLSSTVSVTMGIFSAIANLCIGFVFACYLLLQKERLGRQVRKVLQAIYACEAGSACDLYLQASATARFQILLPDSVSRR